MAPSAPSSPPAASARRSSGRSEIAAGCRSLDSSGPSFGRIARAQCGYERVVQRRVRDARRGQPCAAFPCLLSWEARMRSHAAYTSRRGQPAGGERQHPVERTGCERRGDLLAPSHPDRCPPQQAERDIAADTGCQLIQLLLAQPGAPQLVARDQGGRGIGAAAGQAGRHRDPLGDPDRQAGSIAGAGPGRLSSAPAARAARLAPSAGTLSAPSPVTATLSRSAGATVTSSNSETA